MKGNISFWEHDTYFEKIDVAIVGAGIVGLCSALEIKKKDPSLKIVVFERGNLPMGASTKNAGFACFGSPTELLDDIEKISAEDVRTLVKKRWMGLHLLRSNLGDEAIGYEENGGNEVFLSKQEYERCADSLGYINKIIADIFEDENVFTNASDRIDKYHFAKISNLIHNKYEGQLNTGKMMLSLYKKAVAEGIIILYGYTIQSIVSLGSKAQLIFDNKQEVNCEKALVTTNGFAKRIFPNLEVQPARSQVLITSPIKDLAFKGTFHLDKGYYYFRNVGSRVLFGGGRNLDMQNEYTDEFATTEIIQNRLEELLKNYIIPGQSYTIEKRWSGILGVGPVKSSIIKKLEPSVYCAVRMGGMGVAIGSLVAQDASQLVLNS